MLATTLMKPPRPTRRLTARSRILPARNSRGQRPLRPLLRLRGNHFSIDLRRQREFQSANAEVYAAQAHQKEKIGSRWNRRSTTGRKPPPDAGLWHFEIKQRAAQLDLGTGAADRIPQLCDRDGPARRSASCDGYARLVVRGCLLFRHR